jgi:hypothetical protein
MSGELSGRKRSPFWLAATLACAAGVALFAGWTYLGIAKPRHPAAPANGPHLEKWSSAAMDLGDGKPGEVLTGTFRLRNVGTEPLRFHIAASCACAQLQPREGTVAAGDAVEVLAGVRLRSEGSREHVRLQIMTNDPQEPVAEFYVQACCPAPFEVTPQAIDFGDVSAGASPEVRLRVRDGKGNPLAPESVRIEGPASPHVSVVQDAKGKEFVAFVRLSRAAPPGRFATEIKLRAMGGEKTMRVPVTANVLPLVLIAPRTLELRSPREGKGVEGEFLVWRTDGALLGKLLAIDTPPGLAVAELDSSGRRRRFRVRAEAAANAVDLVPLRLSFQDLTESVAVAVRLPVREPRHSLREKEAVQKEPEKGLK